MQINNWCCEICGTVFGISFAKFVIIFVKFVIIFVNSTISVNLLILWSQRVQSVQV